MGKHTYRGEREIIPNDTDVKKAQDKLRKHYREIEFGTPAQIEVKAEEIINKAKWGWSNAKMPKNAQETSDAFHLRVFQLMGPNSNARKRALKEKIRKREEKAAKSKEGFQHTTFIGDRVKMNDNERFFMMDRYAKYEEDFEFNSSADRVLLDQIVVDEVLLRRLEVERLGRIELDSQQEVLAEKLTERYRKNLQLLGVSRQQRVESDLSVEGNIAELSDHVEQKLNNIREMTDKTKKNKVIDELVNEHTPVTKEEILEWLSVLELYRKHLMFPEKNFISEAELISA